MSVCSRAAKIVFALLFVILGACSRNRAVPAGEAILTEAPFNFTKMQIVLTVRIAGAGPYNVMVDTGVDPSVIDLGLARSLGLPLDMGAQTAGGGAGSAAVSVFPSQIRRLQLGGFEIDSLEAVAVDLTGMSARLGMPLHGILGYSFFKGRVVQIDYRESVLRLLNATRVARPGVTMPFVFRPNDIIPLVPIMVNGISATVSLDTGSGQVLEIFPGAVDKLRLRNARAAARPIELAGARGAFTATTSRADSLQFGTVRLTDFEVIFSSRSAQLEKNRDGNLGNGALRRSVVTLDYLRNLVTVEVSANP